jgi:MFS family permease
MNINTFNAFKSRNYRLYFTGQSVSLIGTWMQRTAVSWVVYEKTHSNFMLGLILFASMFPSFLFSFVGGVVSDRYDRFKVLLVTQVASMLQALMLTLIIFSGNYPVWIIIALSTLLGVIKAFDVPVRQSLVVEMIDDKTDLPNALALNSSMVNLSRLIGPGLAGFALEHLGDVTCFGLNAISFIAVIISLLMMKLPKQIPNARTTKPLDDLKDGFKYIKETASIATVLITLAFVSFLALPFSSLIPVFAKEIFNGTASTFGIIDSAIGLGALSGAIFLASLKKGRNLQFILAINTLIFGAALMLFSQTGIYSLALVFAVFLGFGMMSQTTISNTLVQLMVKPSMRGRVISFYAMAFFGMQPIGGLLTGYISQKIGAPNTVLLQGAITIIIAIFLLRYVYTNKKKELHNSLKIVSNVAVEV